MASRARYVLFSKVSCQHRLREAGGQTKAKELAANAARRKKNTMKKYFALIAVAALIAVFVLSTAGSSAQQQQKRETAPDPRDMRIELERMQGPGVPPPPGDFLFMSTEMAVGGKVVKDAPYSAQAVSESTQTLSDGNRIVSKSTSAVYRDSEGRTRREQTLRAIGPFATGGDVPQMIFIDDPFAGVS